MPSTFSLGSQIANNLVNYNIIKPSFFLLHLVEINLKVLELCHLQGWLQNEFVNMLAA